MTRDEMIEKLKFGHAVAHDDIWTTRACIDVVIAALAPAPVGVKHLEWHADGTWVRVQDEGTITKHSMNVSDVIHAHELARLHNAAIAEVCAALAAPAPVAAPAPKTPAELLMNRMGGSGFAPPLRVSIGGTGEARSPRGDGDYRPCCGGTFKTCDCRSGSQKTSLASVAALAENTYDQPDWRKPTPEESPLAHAAVEATAKAHGWNPETDTLAGWLHARLSELRALRHRPAPETPVPDAAPLPCPECREVDRVWAVGDGRYRCAACDVGYTLGDVKTPAPDAMPEDCANCEGRGYQDNGDGLVATSCETCNGTGRRRQEAQP